MSAAERFAAKVAVDLETECHVWLAHRNPKGYGRFNADRTVVLAHRYAWEQTHGPVPGAMFVCHSCDNPACVNVEHLFLGTAADNSADMVAKGRSPRSSGERSGKAKLTQAQVDEMRALRADGCSVGELARRFGVHNAHASRILSGKRWPS